MMMKENVYAAPKSQVIDDTKPFALCADGRYVVTKRDTGWGDRCCYCNEVVENKTSIKVHYYPLWAKLFGFILGLFVVLILRLGLSLSISMAFSALFVLISTVYLMSKTIKVRISMCTKHKRLRWVQLSSVFFFMALFAMVSYLLIKLQYPMWSLKLVFVLLIVAFVVTVVRLPKPLVSERKLGDLFWVKGTSEAFRDSLPEFR